MRLSIPDKIARLTGPTWKCASVAGLSPAAVTPLVIGLVWREYKRFMATGARPKETYNNLLLALVVPEGFKRGIDRGIDLGRGGQASIPAVVLIMRTIIREYSTDPQVIALAMIAGRHSVEDLLRGRARLSDLEKVRGFFSSEWVQASELVSTLRGFEKPWNPASGRCTIHGTVVRCYDPIPKARTLDLVSGSYSGEISKPVRFPFGAVVASAAGIAGVFGLGLWWGAKQ